MNDQRTEGIWGTKDFLRAQEPKCCARSTAVSCCPCVVSCHPPTLLVGSKSEERCNMDRKTSALQCCLHDARLLISLPILRRWSHPQARRSPPDDK